MKSFLPKRLGEQISCEERERDGDGDEDEDDDALLLETQIHLSLDDIEWPLLSSPSYSNILIETLSRGKDC